MRTDKFIDTTSAAVANLVPAITGLTGNLAFAAAGAVIAPILQSGISEMAHQVLGYRQQKKVMTTANITCNAIVKDLEAGKRPRNDKFFTPTCNEVLNENESSASKLFEGSLLKAKEEYDSKKIPFYSFFTANVFFTPNISENKAFVMLEILSKLTYRQLCALKIFYNRNVLPIGRWEAMLKDIPALQDSYDIAYEFISLKDLLLIVQNIPGQGIGVADYRISSLGKDLVITSNLNSLPKNDLIQLENKINYITSSIR